MALSKFLPDDFDAGAKIAVLAGKGAYPEMLVERLRENDIKMSLVAFEGETSPELVARFSPEDADTINVGQLGKLLKALRRSGAKYAMMAGQITPKRLFKGLKLDLKAMLVMAKLKRRNAETIFGAIAEQLELAGVKMLDARSFLDSELAPQGLFAGKKWSVSEDYARHGMEIAREMARLDIGQSCVVARGSVLAVEAWEGTDKMIERAGQFEARGAVFVKTVKPNQDYRFDVPVIGERTVRKLAAAKIENAIVEAGKVLILEKDKVKKLADEHNIKIFGV